MTVAAEGPGPQKNGRQGAGAAVRDLLGRMTFGEKIGQLNLLAAGEGLATGAAASHGGVLGLRLDAGAVGAVFGVKSRESALAMQRRAVAGSRLGLPLFFAEDVIHGHRTVFPLPLGLAASWDMALVEETARVAAAEASAEGLHQVYAPMVDVARDARWGRIAESPGEDPVLAAAYAAAMVRGLQGDDPAAPGRVAACLKHFIAYGAPQSGRDYDNASLSPEDVFDVHAPPFAAGVAAGAATVMVAFNAVNRMPMHAHQGLVEGWLRGRLGFDGLVVSDYTGVRELQAHGLGGRAATVLLALRAGVDMDMVGEDYLSVLPALAEDGIDCAETGLRLDGAAVRALIDRACGRVLAFKARLGLLENPFRGLEGASPTRRPSPGGRALARRAAAAGSVLLRNDGVLPLATQGRLALVGPLADDCANLIGTWSVAGDAAEVTTLRAALARRTGLEVIHARGCNLVDAPWLTDRLNVHGPTVVPDPRDEPAMIAEACAAARAASVAVVAVGEAKEQAGESSSVLSPVLPATQRRLLAALAATGTRLVVVVCAGRPLALGALEAAAMIFAPHGGVEAGAGLADILLGEAEPSGRLPVSLPAHPGQTPLSHASDPTGRPNPGRFAKFLTGWLDLEDDAAHVGGAVPFGFGLSYTRFVYGAPQADRREGVGEEDALTVSVDVTNAGARPGVETVQLYLSDPVARVVRPARALKTFRRLALQPGETGRARFTVDTAMLRYTIAPSLAQARSVWDPGAFVLHIGPNSRDTQPLEIAWRA